MPTLSTRSFAGELDFASMAELVNACDAFDQLDDGTSVEELRDEFSSPFFHPERDVRLWETEGGQLIGLGLLWIPPTGVVVDGFLWMKVHPAHRDDSLEPEILGWAEARVREVGQERGQPAKLRAGGRTDQTKRLALLEQHGFTTARYFLRMARPLDAPIPDPVLPSGFTLRHVEGPHEVPAWVDLYNESFIDHYNHHPLLVEDRLHWLEEAHYRPEQDIIVVAPDGTFVAFCICYINAHENQRSGRQEGWVSLLGSRRGYRKLGLGRAALLAGLRQLKADGADTALLGVDADSPTGATRLYESAGFSTRFTQVAMVKEL